MPVDQGWALIGLIGVLIVAILTLVSYAQRSLKGHMDARFDAVNQRLDRLDSDVQALVNRIFRGRT
jgi:Flp pilus assembly pilin Flp